MKHLHESLNNFNTLIIVKKLYDTIAVSFTLGDRHFIILFWTSFLKGNLKLIIIKICQHSKRNRYI